MANPVKLIPNGDFEIFEVAGGRDDTKWFHVVEYDDGSTSRVDPDDYEAIAAIKAAIENPEN